MSLRSPRTSRRTTLVLAGLTVLLVVTSVVATIAATRQSDERLATPARPNSVRVAVIGDSYSAGSSNAVVWPSLLANVSSYSVSNFAVPGAGYVGGVGESGPFLSQVDRAMASKPNAIIVFGGINDVGKSKELIQQAAMDLFTELARRAPTSQIVVVGPLWHEDPPPEEAVAIDQAVSAAAEATRTAYVRVINEAWLVRDGLIQPDGIHPTDEGQRVIARELGSLLTRRIRIPSNETGA